MEKEDLFAVIDRFAGKKIAVWGDFILDEYIYGKTRRISREAPVLILSYQKREFSLGGAGNSALNLRALGASPIPIGVIGQDLAGTVVADILKAHDIKTKNLIRLKNFETPLKTRILAGEENTRKQQILRIDKDAKVPEMTGPRKRVARLLQEALDRCHALLVSDYNYLAVRPDILAEVLPLFKKARKPVTLDTRFRLLHFKGITAATPNEPEVEEALKTEIGENVQRLKRAGNVLRKKLQSPALLITRGSRGMALFERGRPAYLIPVHGPTDIVDVTGAGDTVISVFTLALACGASFRQATELANYAGGIVVMKKGTATVTTQELKEAISS